MGAGDLQRSRTSAAALAAVVLVFATFPGWPDSRAFAVLAFMAQYAIALIGGGFQKQAIVWTDTQDRECRLELQVGDQRLRAQAGDFFEAFCTVRLVLEQQQLRPVCYGASLNVYPSGMARDMGRGLRAYRLTVGRSASSDDLVDIFDSGPDVVPAQVGEQRAFFEAWLASLRQENRRI